MPMVRLLNALSLCLVTSLTVASFDSFAQSTPQDPVFAGTKITFTPKDILNAMTDDERKDFLEMREKLKQLKQAKNSRKLDPAVREASAISYQLTSEKFEEEFGAYRGFNGATVTVYGFPIPTKREIFAVVLGGRFAGKTVALHQHWTRDCSSCAVVGVDSKPTWESSGHPAGKTHSLQVPISGEPTERAARASAPEGWYVPAAGTCQKQGLRVPSNWDYQSNGNPSCLCRASVVMGLPSCAWLPGR